jgi:protein-disulfide isomerase/uncharacterized membrane protein
MNTKALQGKSQIILGLSVLGIVNAAYTLYHRQALFARGLQEQSFCSVNEYINCDAVALSSSSSLFFGYPNSAFGVIFYALAIVLALTAYFSIQDKKAETAQSAASGLLVLSATALVPTLVLAGVSFVQLRMICPMCVLSYIINSLVTWFAWRLRKELPGANFLSLNRNLWMLAGGLALILAPLPMIMRGAANPLDDATVNSIIYSHNTASQKSFSLEKSPSEGAADAKVTIVEFSDFQCPFCAQSALVTPQIARAYEGKVRFFFKNYPLDSSCNKNMDRPAHPQACSAAKAGHCIHKLKGNEAFFTFKKAVFAQQAKLGIALLKELGSQAGIGPEELEACMNDPATHEAIVQDVAEGQAAGVSGTPSLFVNGRALRSGSLPEVMKKVIDSYLAN